MMMSLKSCGALDCTDQGNIFGEGLSGELGLLCKAVYSDVLENDLKGELGALGWADHRNVLVG